MGEVEIDAEVEAFLAGAERRERHYRLLADHLLVLQSMGWKVKDIEAVHARVNEKLRSLGKWSDIDEAVLDCVDYAFNDDQPVEKIAEFIFILKESGCSDSDLDVVKTRVFEEWSKRSDAQLN